MQRKIEGRRRGWQRIGGLDNITDSMDISLSKLWEILEDRGAGVLQSVGLQGVRHNLVTEQLQCSLIYRFLSALRLFLHC